jgi:hypothetical protein
VRAFLEQHGSSRFEAAWTGDPYTPDGVAPDPLARTVNRAGFRRLVGERPDQRWEYYVLPEAWRQEVCKGLDAGAVARALADAGWLRTDKSGKLATLVRVPGAGPTRVYAIDPGFLGGEDGEERDD